MEAQTAEQPIDHATLKEDASRREPLRRAGPAVRIVRPHAYIERSTIAGRHFLNAIRTTTLYEVNTNQTGSAAAQRSGSERPDRGRVHS